MPQRNFQRRWAGKMRPFWKDSSRDRRIASSGFVASRNSTFGDLVEAGGYAINDHYNAYCLKDLAVVAKRAAEMRDTLLRFRVALIVILASTPALTPLAHATVVIGTGNPRVDVPAVQAAVNLGGKVVLRGRFSFNIAPTIPTALRAVGFPPATILISKAVSISGSGHASIEGGTIPFYVQAPGATVTIQHLRFVRPAKSAIFVYAVRGLVIASCSVNGITPLPNIAFSGIGISASDMAVLPTPGQPGHPENISGTIVIANNDMDLTGGTAADNVLGITTFSVGQWPNREVDLYISGNKIKNVTQPGINLRRISGRAHVEANVITTGPLSSQNARRPEAIRAANIGSYVIARNVIHSQWPDPNAIGIGLFSQAAEWPVADAVVVNNEVTMSPPQGVLFGSFSAAIDIRGFAENIVVRSNKIRGRARAALAADAFNGGLPHNITFVLNRLGGFEASVAGVIVANGVSDTVIRGQQRTVNDQGVNTAIVPFQGRPGPAIQGLSNQQLFHPRGER